MLNQFRHFYPQGTIFSELINIDRGLYIVKVTLQDRNIVLGTGFAAAETIEKAEDRARERALMTVNLDKPNTDTTQIQQSQPQTESIAIAEKPTENVKPPQTKPTIPTAKTPSIEAPQEVLSYDGATDSPLAQETNHHTAIAEAISPEPIADIVPPVAETPPVEETQNIFEQPTTPPVEEIQNIFEQPTTPPVEETQNIFEQPVTPPVEETQNIFEQPVTPPVEETTIKETAEEATETIQLDFNEIKHKTDLEMKRLGWTKEQGRDYLLSTYGKRSRLHLTDEELLEFWRYLETLPN